MKLVKRDGKTVVETDCCTCGKKIVNESGKPTPIYCSEPCFEVGMAEIETPSQPEAGEGGSGK